METLTLVATVEHSGTFRLLGFLGYQFRGTRPLEEREQATKEILFAHLHDQLMPMILEHDGPIVTTRRPEADIRESWRRRGKSESDLERQLANYQILLARKPYVLELGCP